jgi:hypothetical protein
MTGIRPRMALIPLFSSVVVDYHNSTYFEVITGKRERERDGGRH